VGDIVPKKKYSLRQTLRKSKAKTKGADAQLANLLARVMPIVKRSKVDRPLTKRELDLLRALRDILALRLEVAAIDAPLHDFEQRLNAGEIVEQ
jgi:hypothetical protein